MEEYMHLPNGHLLNLEPRARNGGRPTLINEGAENDQNEAYTTGLDQKPAGLKGGSPKTPPQSLLRRGRPTKLPKPRVFADRARDQKKEESVTPRIKEQKVNTHVQNRQSPGAANRESPKATDKDREQYWRKVREKFDKDSPTSTRSKDKQKDYYQEAYRKIRSLASTPKHEIAKHKLKVASPTTRDARLSGQGAKASTKTAGPSVDSQGSPASKSRSHSASQIASRSTKDRQAAQETREIALQGSPEKIYSTTDSSIHSHPSISPVSCPSSSMTEWEDRFVVNMPSARDPNPPTMSVEQIMEFQKSIEKVHKEGETMLDPDTLPSPRTTTPEDKPNPPEHERKQLGTLDGQDSRSTEVDDQAPTYGHNRYYSPDEIGKQRFSTIWEESPSKPKQKAPEPNPDGSFLGCREINGPNDKNPDEILFFSTANERPRVVDVSVPMAKAKEWKKLATPSHPATPALEEKTVVQEEWKPISQNLKHAQCSKQSPKTMCRETTCTHQEKPEMSARISGKENTRHAASTTRIPNQRKNQGDDVFIITPTITRTMVTMADTRSATSTQTRIQQPTSRVAGETVKDARVKPQMSSSPSGLRRATQNSWERSHVTYTVPSRGTPITSTPVVQQTRAELEHLGVERRRAIRGYIRMPGMVKSRTENLGQRTHNSASSHVCVAPPSNENQPPARSVSDSSQFFPSSAQDISPASSLTRDQRNQKAPPQTARIVEVAELDGLQVDDPKEESRTDHKEDHRSSDKCTPREHARLKVTDLHAGLQASVVQPDYRGVLNSVTMSLLMDIFVLSAAQAQGLFAQIMDNRHSRTDLFRVALNCVLNMAEHCLHVFRNLLHACSVYTTTGAWPRPSEKDFARLLTDLYQATIYLAALGFIMMLVGRALGYVVLIGSWIVWFIRPIGWLLGALGRVLLGMTS
ncbi:hypothetical protein BDV23DRAFT_186243 [Aspergillus alliaceus]|uniref:NTP binding protein n=1 Tax=Petromyces alliaceus TaxID=209559 RepID=A0A5N7C0G3_PETAA|nr:hypothetical protein BDV23DRAFT_186243 [Aspergillus alliaceus]